MHAGPPPPHREHPPHVHTGTPAGTPNPSPRSIPYPNAGFLLVCTLVALVPYPNPNPNPNAGFLLVCTLVALDLALTNIAVALLAVAIQQCIVATNPAFTVTIESI